MWVYALSEARGFLLLTGWLLWNADVCVSVYVCVVLEFEILLDWMWLI